MLKVITLFKRCPGASLAEFEDHWIHRHAPLVCRLPKLRRYVQSQTIASGYKKGEPAVDGMAELWFDDTAALRALQDGSELRAVLNDEINLMAPTSRCEIITEDVVIKDGPIPPNGVKNIELVVKRPDLSTEVFHRYWVATHGPLGGSIPQVHRYVQSHTRLAAYRDNRKPPLDGVALTWFDDTAAMRAAALTSEYANTRADEHNFLTEPLAFVITRERVMLG
ncbi:MAG: EthD family reductase [Gammaproteobacteria bacterium]|nr:EthD family reductase [Gammaproteobacteria bacterium]